MTLLVSEMNKVVLSAATEDGYFFKYDDAHEQRHCARLQFHGAH